MAADRYQPGPRSPRPPGPPGPPGSAAALFDFLEDALHLFERIADLAGPESGPESDAAGTIRRPNSGISFRGQQEYKQSPSAG
ncbi:MAG TPA: hypothetical protein VIP48_18750 [Streptosporangiaceae bacterium]